MSEDAEGTVPVSDHTSIKGGIINIPSGYYQPVVDLPEYR
jgi:hypothetical protein